MNGTAEEAAWAVQDVGEITEVARQLGWDCEYFQRESGQFRGLVSSINLGDVKVEAESWGRRIHLAGTMPDDSFQFTFATQNEPLTFQGRHLRGDELTVAPPGSAFSGSARTVDPERVTVVRVAASRFRRALQDQSRADELRAPMVLRLTGEDRARVRSLVARSFGPLRTKGVELREFEGAIVSALVAAMPGGVRERDNGSERQCAFRKALEYLRANLGEAVCIEDLCRVSGVGARTLRRAFHQESGMGPIAFARAQRLSHARRLLKSGRANSVTQAALASGFSELGRFAASYRAMFGELPSSTRDSRLAENA